MKRDETDVLKLCQTLQSWSNPNIWAVIWLVLGFCCFFGINVRPSKRVWKGKIWYITERLIQKSTDIFKTLKRKSLLTFLKKEIKGKQIMADKNNKILRTDAKKMSPACHSQDKIVGFAIHSPVWIMSSSNVSCKLWWYTCNEKLKSVLSGLLENGHSLGKHVDIWWHGSYSTDY